MRKGIYLASTLAITTVMLACSEQPSFEALDVDGTNSFSSQSAKCDQMGKAVHPTQIQIEGQKIASKGEVLSYRLAQAASCLEDQDIAWKTVSATSYPEQATEYNSVFKKAGTYTISAMVDTEGSAEPTLVSFNTAVLSDKPVITGPEVGLNNRFIDFQLAIPQGQNYSSAEWNFGDGTAPEQSLTMISHAYTQTGTYDIEVALVNDLGEASSIRHRITVIEANDNVTCVDQLAMSVPTEITQGVPAGFSVFVPSCLTSQVVAVSWDFGDGSQGSGDQSTQHTYTEIGSYQVSVELYQAGSDQPWITLVRDVAVQEGTEENDGGVVEEPTGLSCKRPGQTREFLSELYTELEACEMDGIKQMSYRDLITQECRANSENILIWTEINRTPELQNEGACEGRACTLPNGSTLSHGESATLFKTPLPEGTCSSVAENRTCNDGTLEGSVDHVHMSCQEGCTGFGSHGTVKSGIETGTITEALVCSFGEQGYSNLFKEISDKTCELGTVVTSNPRRGDLITAGTCPSYEWQATDTWSQCSANCGGNQNRQYICVSSLGVQVDDARCTSAQPTESRVCDGNPEAVRRQEVQTESEEVSSRTCPSNQLGTVTKARDIFTTRTYACIDHSVQLESAVVTEGEWETHNYCRDFVAHRCNHDSLDNNKAKGRLAWMQKCQDEQPMLKDYLEQLDGYKVKNSDRLLYPTFLDSTQSPERVWKAPSNASGSCAIPEGVYIAAVCVSSCSTPEQQIMVSDDKKTLEYKSFFDALAEKTSHVATLPRASTMKTKMVKASAVEQWVTELIDSEHDILKFTMESGRTLRVTTNHPIVDENGRMKLAADFRVGDNLVQLGGDLDRIVSLEAEDYYGKVYNLFVKSADPRQNIVVINGYLNGTAFFQNEGAKHMNRTIFRSNLLRGIFEK